VGPHLRQLPFNRGALGEPQPPSRPSSVSSLLPPRPERRPRALALLAHERAAGSFGCPSCWRVRPAQHVVDLRVAAPSDARPSAQGDGRRLATQPRDPRAAGEQDRRPHPRRCSPAPAAEPLRERPVLVGVVAMSRRRGQPLPGSAAGPLAALTLERSAPPASPRPRLAAVCRHRAREP